MAIPISILAEAIASLPPFNSWARENWYFLHVGLTAKESTRLHFKKNHKTQSWDLIL